MKCENILLGIILGSSLNFGSIKNLPEKAMDRFLVGELHTNKYSSQYVDSIPQYKQLLEPYFEEYSWGFYIKVDKNNKTPHAGIVFIF